MSYDIYFKSNGKDDKEVITKVRKFFLSCPHYKEDGPQIFYENPASGVYFTFYLGDIDKNNSLFSFNLNYFRPSVFSIEAGVELVRLTKSIDMVLDDPQIGGKGLIKFDLKSFMEKWGDGNGHAIRSILNQSKQKPYVLPYEKLEDIWEWNYDKDMLQLSLGAGIFVPMIFLIDVNGIVKSFSIWPDGCPIAIPFCADYLLVLREKSLDSKGNGPDEALIEYSEAKSILDEYKVGKMTEKYILFDEINIPPFLKKKLSEFSQVNMDDYKRLRIDEVLDEEYVNEYKDSFIHKFFGGIFKKRG